MAANGVLSILATFGGSLAWAYAARQLRGSSPPAVSEAGNLVLTYPMFFQAVGVLGFVLFGGTAVVLATAAWSQLTDPASGPVLAISTCLLALGMVGVFEFLVVRIEVRSDGILGRSPWRKTRFIPWNAIASIEFSGFSKWFIIRGHDGRAIRAHLWLSGIRSLYDSLKLSAPPDAWHARYYAPFET